MPRRGSGVKLTVKLTSNSPDNGATLRQFLEGNSQVSSRVNLILDDCSVDEADVWIVLDQVESTHDQRCAVPPGCFVMVSNESAYPTEYFTEFPARMEYLAQFDVLYSHHNLPLRNAIKSPPFLPWMINANHASVLRDHPRNRVELVNLRRPKKTGLLSMVVSDKTITSSQRKRLEFAYAVEREFGDDVAWFGNGFNSVNEKFEAIAPYRFHIAMENRIGPSIFSEKLVDAYLGWSLPLYWGAPDVFHYFPRGSLVEIDACDHRRSLSVIRDALRGSVDETSQGMVNHARQVALTSMNWVNRLARLAEDLSASRPRIPRSVRVLRAPTIASHVGYRELNATLDH